MFLATYEATGAYVAIKHLNATLRRDAEFMDRYRSDTHRLVDIDDPHVVRLYEYVETSGRAALVMELVDGVTLRTLLTEHGRTSPEAALAVLKSTLLALAAAHERGVPHRDVKPENILVQADGTGKLADFGVVVHAEAPGVPAGTPAYMSPELWTHHRAGPPADLYAAACVLFEAVRGRPPYRTHQEEPDVSALRERHLEAPVPLEVAPDTLRDLLKRGMAKDPATRYASARQFAAEVEEDAVAGYGPDWEKRGRRHLAELATSLALTFPLARTEQQVSAGAGLRDRAVRVPRLPPQLWVAGATVAAAALAIMVSGGRLPPGPGTILIPPPETRTEPGTAATQPAEPPPTPRPARSTRDAATTTARPSATASGRAPTSPPPASRSVAPPVPSPARSPVTSTPVPSVRSAAIARWNGKAGAIRVAATGPGPVRLRIAYTRRDGDGGAVRTLREETRVLRGKTAYTSEVTHAPGDVGCGGSAYLGLVVMTEPAAANGPQVYEVAVRGPECTFPPTPSGSPDPTPTSGPSASGSPQYATPSGPGEALVPASPALDDVDVGDG